MPRPPLWQTTPTPSTKAGKLTISEYLSHWTRAVNFITLAYLPTAGLSCFVCACASATKRAEMLVEEHPLTLAEVAKYLAQRYL